MDRRAASCVWLLAAAAAVPAFAQPRPAGSYPAKPIRVIVGFPPASAADIVARVTGARLAEQLGQQIIVDNRPGAGSNIAADLAAKAPPDGHTLFIGTVANTINASLYSRLPFDFSRDFAPVMLTASVPNVVVVHPSLPVRNVRELVALAKQRPGELSYGSSGTGTAPHLSGELFRTMAGVNIVHVPYRGSPQAVTDLIGGAVALMFSPASSVIPHVKSSRLRAIAVTTARRIPSLPGVPTVSESGLPGYETTTWFGYTAPARTDAAVVSQLNTELAKTLKADAVREPLTTQGMDILGGTPAEFARYIADEIAKWARVVRASGARAD